MNITLRFSKLLANTISVPNTVALNVDSYKDIISALVNLFPQLSSMISTSKKKNCLVLLDGDKLVRNSEFDFKPRSNTIYIVPTVSGGLTSGFDSLGNLSLFYGSSSAMSNQAVALTGLNRRILESSLYGQSQTAFDIALRASNRASGLSENTDDPTTGFGSLSLTTAAGQNIALNFGLVRTSGAVISSYIKHIQRGNIDTVKVTDYI
jgi:predicted phage tail protein